MLGIYILIFRQVTIQSYSPSSPLPSPRQWPPHLDTLTPSGEERREREGGEEGGRKVGEEERRSKGGRRGGKEKRERARVQNGERGRGILNLSH